MGLTAVVSLAGHAVDIFVDGREDPIGSIVFDEIIVVGQNNKIIAQAERHEPATPTTPSYGTAGRGTGSTGESE